jgi:hypothetical protein
MYNRVVFVPVGKKKTEWLVVMYSCNYSLLPQSDFTSFCHVGTFWIHMLLVQTEWLKEDASKIQWHKGDKP